MALLMQEDQHEDGYKPGGRRMRTAWIVIAHLLVVAGFFVATFYWGNFA